MRFCGLHLRTIAGILLLTLAALPYEGRADDKTKFSRWEKAIARFEKQDEMKPPPKNAILFAGSSSIVRWNLAKSFPDLDVINRGFGGSEIADSVHFAPRIILKHSPRLIVFYAGDNDLARGRTPDEVFHDFQALVKSVHTNVPKARIVFLSIKSSPARWKLVDKQRQANNLIADFCKKDERLHYLDVDKPMLGTDGKPRPELFVKDGLHLNEKGYELWTALVRPHLK